MNRIRECCFKTVPTEGRRLVWEITHDCSMDCDYCFQAKKRQKNPMRILNSNDLNKICDKIKDLGVKDALITGGEIYHAKDELENICNNLKKSGIKISFSTANIFNKEFIDDLLNFSPRSLNISLDPRPKNMTEKTWEKYLQGAEYTLAMGDSHPGVSVKITGVISAANIANINEYLDLIKSFCQKYKSISAIYVTNPYDIGYIKNNIRAKEHELNTVVEKISTKSFPPAIKLVNFPRNNAPLQRCLAGSHYVHIEPNGNVYPCHLFANYNENVFSMGNILHDDVQDINTSLRLFSEQVLSAVEDTKREIGECKSCKVVETCGGGCLAETISIGQLIEPQLICKYITPPKRNGGFTPKPQLALNLHEKDDLTEEEEKQIIDHIQSNLRRNKHDLAHGFDHTLCVVQLARYIAKKESANLRVVTAAAYFHDFAPRQVLLFEMHTKISAEMAAKFLRTIGFSEQELSDVYRCIDTSSYGSAQLGKQPQSLEAKIVRDADWLDAIGARGIARVFAFASAHDCEVLGEVNWDPDYPPHKKTSLVGPDPSPIYHFFSKLLWVRDEMQTETGKMIANKRHKRLVQFLKDYKAEMPSKDYDED